jgi:hypothetical protein
VDLASRRVLGVRIPVLIYITFFVVVGVLLLIGLLMGSGPKPGDVLLEDDFSEASSRWPAGATDGGFTSFADGAYRFGVDPGGSLSAVTDLESDQPDVRAAVRVVRMPAAGDVLLGFACRVAGDNRFDELVIASSGRWAILRRPDREVLGEGSFDPSLLGSGPVSLEAECAGGIPERDSRLAISVNGTVVGVGHDRQSRSSTAPGGVGMVVENGGGDPADVRFDDFRVTVA